MFFMVLPLYLLLIFPQKCDQTFSASIQLPLDCQTRHLIEKNGINTAILKVGPKMIDEIYNHGAIKPRE